jgi:hypothetical protein
VVYLISTTKHGRLSHSRPVLPITFEDLLLLSLECSVHNATVNALMPFQDTYLRSSYFPRDFI